MDKQLMEAVLQQSREAHTLIYEFKAGKCEHQAIPETNKFKITSDSTKGKVQIIKMDANGAVYLQWIDRITDNIERKVLLTHNCAKVVKVEAGKVEDRVILIQFLADKSRRFFYWLQEKDTEKDTEIIEKITEQIAKRQATTADMRNVITGQSEQLDLSKLDFSSLNFSGAPTAAPATTAPVLNQDHVSLPDVLEVDALCEAIEELDDAELDELAKSLPEGQQTREQVIANLRSPQFTSTLRHMTHALHSDDVNSLFSNFNLNPVDGQDEMANGNFVSAFVRAFAVREAALGDGGVDGGDVPTNRERSGEEEANPAEESMDVDETEKDK
eukprot:TRINITY_DN6077_c0_g1_i1.p1 TRINITY_DN6077_c0_g1~~TRINITY_DN6077_c0_g1_i1.p1  ORF type:complete len:329 (-),score=114.81 TRINITY_DN6077_c0_g1_i1:101-1087(-)